MQAPPKYRTTNWQTYNRSLKQRGQLLLWLNKDMSCLAPATGKHSRPPTFSDAAILFCLSIKRLFRLTYGKPRACCVWLVSAGQYLTSVRVPAGKKPYRCVLQCRSNRVSCILVDSTVIRVRGESEWKVKKHGADYRRQWCKLNLEIDA